VENIFTTQFHPGLDKITENPPRFTWPMAEEKAPYTLEVSQSDDFAKSNIRVSGILYNFYTPDEVLPPGEYFWRVSSDSTVRSFTVSEGLHEAPLPGEKERYKNANAAHPRLWLNPDKLAAFKAKLKSDPSYCNFDEFYKHSVANRIEAGFPDEPKRYPNDIRVVALWRSNYMACQQAMCYIRSLSIAGVVLEDKDIIAKAKKALLAIANWDYELATGSTTRLYNDECCYRVGHALAYGYDWLYNHMTDTEKEKVFDSLYIRTKEVAEYAIIEKKIHNFPYDSHAVRSLSMMIIPCCIAMLDLNSNDPRHADAKHWLDYALEYLSAIYTPWGGADGGWAEGPAYWTTGMAFVTEALNFARNYLDVNLFKRTFFQQTGAYMLHCNPPDTYRASFGDQSNLGDRPGPKMAFNMRQFAGIVQNGQYQWYCNRVMERAEMAPEHFSEKGWWDLHYDDVVFTHDYGNIQEEAPPRGTQVKHFRDIGWVAINKNMADFDNHVMLLTKSSPFGSLSHSHADQNAVLLFAYGQPLLIISGHYVGYGTQMHLNWRKQTRSTNSILIDGIGQYSGRDFEGHHKVRAGDQDITAGEEKVKQLSAKGEIVSVVQQDGQIRITADATQAYIQNVPYLSKYVREIIWQDDDNITIKDYVSLTQKGCVSALMHAVNPFEVHGDSLTLKVGNVTMEGKTESTSGLTSITQGNAFEGVNEPESEGLTPHYHVSINTNPAESHEITTHLRIIKA